MFKSGLSPPVLLLMLACFIIPVFATTEVLTQSDTEHRVPIIMSCDAATFSVWVPTEFTVCIDEFGITYFAKDAFVQNNSSFLIDTKSSVKEDGIKINMYSPQLQPGDKTKLGYSITVPLNNNVNQVQSTDVVFTIDWREIK